MQNVHPPYCQLLLQKFSKRDAVRKRKGNYLVEISFGDHLPRTFPRGGGRQLLLSECFYPRTHQTSRFYSRPSTRHSSARQAASENHRRAIFETAIWNAFRSVNVSKIMFLKYDRNFCIIFLCLIHFWILFHLFPLLSTIYCIICST